MATGPSAPDPLNPSLEEAAAAVAELVRTFAENAKHYLSPTYSEAEVRKDFIDKFLFALGWDVNHDVQKNPYRQEVKVERAVQTAMAQRRADYSFSLEPHYESPVLYLEAKNPHEEIATADNYFQTIRYANQQGHAIGILTSFAELHVIDCRFLANIETALQYGLQKYTYEELADPGKFRWIYYLLSRPAILDGAIGRYAETLPKPKGRRGHKAFLPVAYKAIDDRLLETLDELRSDLARSLKNRNPHLESGELTELTQRILDRLVFIRFLEDKLIEPNPIIPTLGRSRGRSAWEDFLSTSRRLDGIYNGIVFRRHDLLDDPAGLAIDDKHFSDLLDGFDFHKSKYLFNEIPLYILGSIYERFLGNVIVATAKRATLEPKAEVRKAGGVYYTPKYIADYIVANTVGKLIAGKSPPEIAKMRFADIACGSGSFLLAMYDCLLKYVTGWYIDHPSKAPKGAVVKHNGEVRLSLTEKSRILLDNIFGVDISPQAVEVAQLSLYLKLLEDETTSSARQYTLEFHRPLLPSLADNIKCGNSLIGMDFYKDRQLDMLDLETARRVRAFDWKAEFPQIFSAGGFDAVVGNPPYIRIHNLVDYYQLETEHIQEQYATAHFGKVDIYVVFLEKGLSLLNERGLLGFIVPNKFMQADYGVGLRKLISERKALTEIVDFGANQVFAGATTYTCLLFLSASPRPSYLAKISRPRTDPETFLRRPEQQEQPASPLTMGAWSISYAIENAIVDRITSRGKPLSHFMQLAITGVKTGANAVFVFEPQKTRGAAWTVKPEDGGEAVEIERQLLRSYWKAESMKRYQQFPATRVLLYPYEYSETETVLISQERMRSAFPKAWKYLNEHKRALEGRQKGKLKGPSWYGLSFASALAMFKAYKIVTPTLSPQNSFSADRLQHFFPQGAGGGCGLVPKAQQEIPYLLGILNSRLLTFFFQRISSRFQGGWFAYEPRYLVRIPLYECDPHVLEERHRHDRIAELAVAILALHPKLAACRTASDKILIEGQIAAMDREIDQTVYELYGLNDAEVKIVEQADEPLDEQAPPRVLASGSSSGHAPRTRSRAKKKPSKKKLARRDESGQMQIFD